MTESHVKPVDRPSNDGGSGEAANGISMSVVICAYTEKRWVDLFDSLDSLTQQTVNPHEVILVIDHNERLLRRCRETFADRGVRVLPNRQQQGLSGARNTGLGIASGDVVAFLDDDATADPNWVERLSSHYQQSSVLGVGGFAKPVWPAQTPTWLPDEFLWVVGCSYTGQPTTVAEVRNFLGCNMSFRRSIFDSVDGFVHGLGRVGAVPMGCEETELCIRVRSQFPAAAGALQLVYEPRALVNHRVSVDRVRFAYFRSRCFAEGLSKASVTQRVGTDAGLATERRYVKIVLPKAVAFGVLRAPRDPWGLVRAINVVVGLAWTTAGYATGKWRARSARSRR